MDLKSQDLLVLFKRAAHAGQPMTFAALGTSLKLSASQVHRSVQRCLASGLAVSHARSDWEPVRGALLEFALHGVRYAFPAINGPVKRGIPTSFGVPPLSQHISGVGDIPVWPHPDGSIKGPSLSPLSDTAPDAALADEKLYALLALLDGIRAGRAREREIASKLLTKALA